MRIPLPVVCLLAVDAQKEVYSAALKTSFQLLWSPADYHSVSVSMEDAN